MTPVSNIGAKFIMDKFKLGIDIGSTTIKMVLLETAGGSVVCIQSVHSNASSTIDIGGEDAKMVFFTNGTPMPTAAVYQQYQTQVT